MKPCLELLLCHEFQGAIHLLWIMSNFQRLLKIKTGSNLSSWNWSFELKNEYFPFRILEKYLLETFSTSNLFSDGIHFSIFGGTKLKAWFSKDCRIKRKFSNFSRNEFWRICYSFLISIKCFKLNFMVEASLPWDFKSSLLNLDFWVIKVLFHDIFLVLHKYIFSLVSKGFVSNSEW